VKQPEGPPRALLRPGCSCGISSASRMWPPMKSVAMVSARRRGLTLTTIRPYDVATIWRRSSRPTPSLFGLILFVCMAGLVGLGGSFVVLGLPESKRGQSGPWRGGCVNCAIVWNRRGLREGAHTYGSLAPLYWPWITAFCVSVF
jgi:hypothetical protein